MNDSHAGNGGPGDGIDPGRPIAEISTLTEPPTPGFLDRVVRRIERRVIAAEAVEFGWSGLALLFREYWSMAMSVFSGGEAPPEEDS